MEKYKDLKIKEFIDILSKREPVPGGGSASAIVGSIGASLLCMVANYSKNKNNQKSVEKKMVRILKECGSIRARLLVLADLDSKAYLKVVKARKGTAKQKEFALNCTKKVSREICSLCYKAVSLTPYLVEKGNKGLIGDVEAAVEMLLAAFNSSLNFLKG